MAVKLIPPDRMEELRQAYVNSLPMNDDDVEALRFALSSEEWRGLQQQRANITPITAGRTEEQIAKEIRADLQGRLEAISEIMTKVKREHGLTVNFGFSPPDSFGRVSLAVLEISKKLC